MLKYQTCHTDELTLCFVCPYSFFSIYTISENGSDLHVHDLKQGCLKTRSVTEIQRNPVPVFKSSNRIKGTFLKTLLNKSVRNCVN